jgi:hypothetical protein
MKSKSVLALGLIVSCGAWAQGGAPYDHHRSPEMEAFCSSNAQDCATLRSLRMAAHQACVNGQSATAECTQARQQFRAELNTLEGEGFPAPHHGPGGLGHAREEGGAPGAD